MSRPDDLLVGLVALAVVPLIAARIVRGLRNGRLPIYRTYLSREDGAGRVNLLLALHAVSLVVIIVIAADLVLDLGLREAL